ncbi:MAG: thiamine-binding protein [Deltaproteobacteria bacterium]|nr:thiamine-binding protein [Deltaproteobacteria bacterium]
MKVQVQISIYPLKTKSLSKPIDEFCRILNDRGLKVEIRTMDSLVVGESDTILKSVQAAFEKIAEKHDVVMDLKVSNACPNETKERY